MAIEKRDLDIIKLLLTNETTDINMKTVAILIINTISKQYFSLHLLEYV